MIKIGEGETAEVYRIEPGKVVKLFRPEFYDEASFRMEYETARQVGEQTGLAPKVLATMRVDGRHGYVMEEIEGRLFQDEIDRNPDHLISYAQLLGEAQRRLHRTPINGGLAQLPRVKEDPSFVRFQGTFPADVASWLKELLASLPNDTALLHGDFMPYNMLMSEDQLRVLDWAEPAIGHPMLGVARTLGFVVDPTDYPDSPYTQDAARFAEHYLAAYAGDESLDADVLHACLILNASFEYRWAVVSRQTDAHSKRLRDFILSNFSDYGSDMLVNLSVGTESNGSDSIQS